ncbi:MAG TPA: NPCBM/NEW2 domain-containing protein [Opitutaceae bacterium]
MTKTDDFTLSILTNPEVIAVNQASAGNRLLLERDDLITWVADVPGSPDKYLALFNARDRIPLKQENAAFRSEVLSGKGTTTTRPIEIDVTGAVKLVLVVDDAGDGTNGDHGVWAEPRLVDARDRETRLTDRPWVSASGGWGQVSTERAPSGRPMSVGGQAVAHGIAGHAKSIVEYDVPKGSVKFRVRGALDDAVAGNQEGATIRMMVFAARPGGTLDLPGLPVSVSFSGIGVPSSCAVRDLWIREDLGDFAEEFAPVIPWHGAGLYRVSPR